MRALCIIAVLACALSCAFAGMLAPGVGLRGSYYAKADMTGPKIVRYAGPIDLHWKDEVGPVADLKPGAFSVQWSGYLLPKFAESYTFTVKTTGGVRLFVNNNRVIDDWSATQAPRRATPVDLSADKLVPIMLQVTQPAGAGSIQLQWSSHSLPVELIPTARLYPPVFAPSQFIYCENPNPQSSALYMTDLTDTPQKITVDGSYKPVFSTDGKKVLFDTIKNLSYPASGICRLDLNTHKMIRLTRAEGEKYDPAYSADGRTIAFVTQIDTSYEIWTMRADGGGRARVLADEHENRHPILNADGSVLIYQSKRDGVWNIYSVHVDGTNEKQLTALGGSEPACNRRGDKIAFISSRSGRPQLYTMGIDGSNQAVVCATPGAVSQPFYIASRDYLAFLATTTTGKTDLYIVDPDDNTSWQVTAHGKIASAAFAYRQELPMADCAFWFTAQEASTLSIDANNRVSTWDDCFQSGLSAVQPNTDRRPIVIKNAINGLSALRFDGIDDFLDTTTPCKVAEMYAVFKVPTDVFNGFKNLLGNKPGYNRLWFLENGNTCFHTNPYPLAVWKNGVNIPDQPYNIAPLNQWMVLACDAANADDNRIYQICAAEDSYFSEFDVAEIICYRSPLSPEDRTAVMNLLKNKYGIQ